MNHLNKPLNLVKKGRMSLSSILISGRQTAFAVAMGCAILLVLFYYLSKNTTFNIRRIPGLDAIDEIVGRCTEEGKPLLTMGISSLAIGGISALSATSYASKSCAERRIRCINIVMAPGLIPLTREIMRDEYTQAGAGDMFDPEDQVRYYGHTPSSKYPAGVARVYAEINPGGVIAIGWGEARTGPAPMTSLLSVAAAVDAGVPIVGGSPRLTSVLPMAISCDYLLIGEEVFACGAYLTKDPPIMGAIVAADVIRLIFCSLLVIGLFLAASGNTALVDLFKM